MDTPAAAQPREEAERLEPPAPGGTPTGEPAAAEPAPEESLPAAVSGPAPAARAPRLVSLDAFRGLTIVGMLLVNNAVLGASTPAHFTHAEWSGEVYFADLVFPWFLFIVGVAIPYSAAGFRKRGLTFPAYLGKVAGRAFWLFLLGCLVDSSVAKRPILGLGVLQLIGLAYAVGALLGGLPGAARLGLAALFLAGHWAAIRFVPVPGIGAGRFTETENLVHYLNQTYLQPLGLKGLVSVVPTAAMVLLGTLAGDLLRREGPAPARKVALLAGCGVLLASLGWLWSHDLPFNKPLWTAPYIVYTAGLGAVLLGALYLLIDVTGWRALGFPLAVFGSNAIVAYVGPILVKIHVLQEWTWTMVDGSQASLQQALLRTLTAEYGSPAGGWIYMAGYVLVWWAVLLVLYRRGLFVRV